MLCKNRHTYIVSNNHVIYDGFTNYITDYRNLNKPIYLQMRTVWGHYKMRLQYEPWSTENMQNILYRLTVT
jgi:hypothetical protein